MTPGRRPPNRSMKARIAAITQAIGGHTSMEITTSQWPCSRLLAWLSYESIEATMEQNVPVPSLMVQKQTAIQKTANPRLSVPPQEWRNGRWGLNYGLDCHIGAVVEQARRRARLVRPLFQ